jgi:TonB family protein
VKKGEVQYPSELKKRGIGGTVQLRATVKADGTVKDIAVIGGSPALADAAKASVREWKFAPGSAETSVKVIVKFDPNS